MFKVLANTQNMPYEEWLEHRKHGIGGSDVSVVCGINKYKSPVQLWMEKTDQLQQEEAGEAAYWDTQLEGLVKSEFTKRTGIEVTEKKELLQSEEYPFMLANLDGICEHPDFGTCVFEAKTASAYKSGEWENSIPDEYLLQIQHYMAVTGYKGTYIAVLIGGNTFKWKFIERDEELISMLIKLESDFWSHVKNMTPPELDGSDACAKFLSEKYPDSVPKSQIQLSETAVGLIQQYQSACEQLDVYKNQKQEAENQLKEMLGENEIGTIGNNVVTWKGISRDSFDSKTLKSEHPNILPQIFGKGNIMEGIMNTEALKTRLNDKVKNINEKEITMQETKVTMVDNSYAALSNNTLDIIRENLKNQPLSVQLFDIVKSPSGGTTAFTVPGLSGDEMEKSITGIILDYTTPRAYWSTPDPVEGTSPECFSSDSLVSSDGKPCSQCVYNTFGSKDGESNAKACKESVLLFMLRPDNIMPILVRIPVSSKMIFQRYLTRLIGKMIPISGVVTKITLEKAVNKTGQPYAVYNFEAVETLSTQDAANAKSFGKQFMEMVNDSNIEQNIQKVG